MDPAHKAQEVGKIEGIYVQNLDAFALLLFPPFLTLKLIYCIIKVQLKV
ncbi:MAG TPA: hypothetical protein VHD33_08180 [Legionellaceae bacterium]|nr:hypothetical protein [Legionellaceae bacterium]